MIVEQLKQRKVIAIIRGDVGQTIDTIAHALLEGGVTTVEVTLNSPGALTMIQHLSSHYGDRMLVGAGTVLETAGVKESAAHGARFIVSPDTFDEVIRAALDIGIEPIPGVLTPTEARTAIRAGARLLKLFPATLGGVDYLRQIRAPLDTAYFIPTGGITADNVADYLRAGAAAVGVGSWLVPSKFTGSEADVAGLTRRAYQLMEAVRQV